MSVKVDSHPWVECIHLNERSHPGKRRGGYRCRVKGCPDTEVKIEDLKDIAEVRAKATPIQHWSSLSGLGVNIQGQESEKPATGD